MEKTIPDYVSALFQCQQAYRNAAIYETFLELNISGIFDNLITSATAAEKLDLNKDALNRFLHAAAYLDIVSKSGNKFKKSNHSPIYSNESSIILFDFFNFKIADFLEQQPKSLSEIEKATGANNEFLKLALKYKLLKIKNNLYSIPEETTHYLLSASPAYIGPLIKHFEKVMFPIYSKKGLLGALKTGGSQWKSFVDNGQSHPFTMYETNAELLELFTNGLHQMNREDDKALAGKINLSNVKTVLDVGGGSGSFALQLLQQSNEISSIDILELPEAIPLMKKIFQKYAPNETRVNYIPGSFLTETIDNHLFGINTIQKYDLIILGWILHDWSDETNIKILKRIANHLNKNKELVIVECILPENRISATTQADLAMLLQTEGRERTIKEFKKILGLAGFRAALHTKTNTKRQIITAKK